MLFFLDGREEGDSILNYVSQRVIRDTLFLKFIVLKLGTDMNRSYTSLIILRNAAKPSICCKPYSHRCPLSGALLKALPAASALPYVLNALSTLSFSSGRTRELRLNEAPRQCQASVLKTRPQFS